MEHTTETERIWHEMHERLLSFIQRRVATVHDAEDILQDVFVRIHAGLGRLKDTQSVVGWTFQIARNAITDYHRRRAVAAGALAKAADDVDESAASGRIRKGETDVTREAGDEFARCLEPLLNELPDPYRQAITLVELNGASQKDAARALGLSVSGMKSRVQRARGKLKDVVLDCCNVELDRRGGLLGYERRDANACGDCDCGAPDPTIGAEQTACEMGEHKEQSSGREENERDNRF